MGLAVVIFRATPAPAKKIKIKFLLNTHFLPFNERYENPCLIDLKCTQTLPMLSQHHNPDNFCTLFQTYKV